MKELKELLSSCEGQRVPVATVLARYYQHFGRLLKIGDHGARRLEDLVDGLPSLQVGVTWLAPRAEQDKPLCPARKLCSLSHRMNFCRPNLCGQDGWILNSLLIVCLWPWSASFFFDMFIDNHIK